MNTNPDAIKVLCFGDSNTNGTKPDRSGRFGAHERWTGIMQNALGNDYYVIEEGLGGRTTDLDHPDPNKTNRNGIEYFRACIDSHMPLDVVIIMLGTNDLKTAYNCTPDEIAQSLRQFPEYVDSYVKQRGLIRPRIILISPVVMNEKAAKFIESMPSSGIYDEDSAYKSRNLSVPIRKVAEETGGEFIDAALIAETGDDGCHMTLASHKNLGEQLAKMVKVS